MGRLDERVALVTGASSGMGRAIALALADDGAAVMCADLQRGAKPDGYEPDLQFDTSALIQRNGGRAAYSKCDVSRLEEMEATVAATVAEFGRLDILVNNAGIFTQVETIIDQSEQDYDLTMAVNAKSVWLGCKFALRQMMTQAPLPCGTRGRIVNIASAAGVIGLPLEPAYCASKGAVVALTRQLAIDFGPHHINVNAIMPGVIQTAMTRGALDDPVIGARFRQDTPFPRVGAARDVAATAAFLASDDAEFINGAAIAVDGGATAA